MNPFPLTSAVTTLANAIACNLTPSEIAFLASILVQLGDTLATIAAVEALCEEANEKDVFLGIYRKDEDKLRIYENN